MYEHHSVGRRHEMSGVIQLSASFERQLLGDEQRQRNALVGQVKAAVVAEPVVQIGNLPAYTDYHVERCQTPLQLLSFACLLL